MLTCWPSFSISRNDSEIQAKIKDISTLRPAPSTEIRGGSHCDSQIGWGPHICKVLPRCITAHFKTPTNVDQNSVQQQHQAQLQYAHTPTNLKIPYPISESDQGIRVCLF